MDLINCFAFFYAGVGAIRLLPTSLLLILYTNINLAIIVKTMQNNQPTNIAMTK